MCLTIPKKIVRITNATADLSDGQAADITLLPDLKVGDWVLVGSGVVLSKLEEGEVKAALNLLKGGTDDV